MKPTEQTASGTTDVEAGVDRPARLIDVARRANVSRATAARAMGGYGNVSDETRERIVAAAQELKYSTNVLARAMRAGTTKTIGVVVADISNSFFSSAIRAIIDTATLAGYQTLLLNTDDNTNTEIDAVRVLLENRVEGLIVVPSSVVVYGHLIRDDELAKPVVLLDRWIEGLDLTSVSTDDRSGAREAVQAFVDKGHRHIGLLLATAAAKGPKYTRLEEALSTVRDRRAGALDAIAAARMPDPVIRYSRSNLEESTAAAHEILRHEPRPTAVLATNEEMALGVLTACMDMGLTLGRDLSLIGFDDTPWTKVAVPAISVVKRPVYDLGRAAVTALIKEIKGHGRQGRIELPTELIDRGSIANCG